MCKLGVMGELHGGGRPGEECVVVGGGDDLVPESASASIDSGVSSRSPCSSTMSSLTDDDVQSSPAAGDRTWSSLSGEDTMQLAGNGGGPLYELSSLMAHLPVRTGLSKYYRGKSQSFTSLSDVKCLQDLAKKNTHHIRRNKVSHASILHHVGGPCSKISKTTTLRGSSDLLLSRARSRGLFHRSGKPPAYQSKKELCSTYPS